MTTPAASKGFEDCTRELPARKKKRKSRDNDFCFVLLCPDTFHQGEGKKSAKKRSSLCACAITALLHTVHDTYLKQVSWKKVIWSDTINDYTYVWLTGITVLLGICLFGVYVFVPQNISNRGKHIHSLILLYVVMTCALDVRYTVDVRILEETFSFSQQIWTFLFSSLKVSLNKLSPQNDVLTITITHKIYTLRSSSIYTTV